MSLCFCGAAFGRDSAISTMNTIGNSSQKENPATQTKLQFIDEDCDGINDIIQNRTKYPNTLGPTPGRYGGQSGSGMFSDEGVGGKRGVNNPATGGHLKGSGRR